MAISTRTPQAGATGRPNAIPASAPTVAQHLSWWLTSVVEPNLEPATYVYYETMARLYIIPALGDKRLDQLRASDVQAWLDALASSCQCCAQGKDAARPAELRRCCAAGQCCRRYPSRPTVRAAHSTLRAALSHARQPGQPAARNVAALAKPPGAPPRRICRTWNVAEACQFLASASDEHDPLYAAYVLIMVNALGKSQVLGLTWPRAELDRGELDVSWRLQRVRSQLILKKRALAQNPGAGDTMPLAPICTTALRLRLEQQVAARRQAGPRWHDSELVFTTRLGAPIEPANFYRSFDARSAKAALPRIRVNDARLTCAPLLAGLNVDPLAAAQILSRAPASVIDGGTQVCDHLTRAALRRLGGLAGPPHTRPGQA